ncbi:hypothetical protein HY990_03015 [Candidatus Micrarchaeota archaeon]|nr:hypothetical protein [Candidatus Micrarchaeota archaeon]
MLRQTSSKPKRVPWKRKLGSNDVLTEASLIGIVLNEYRPGMVSWKPLASPKLLALARHIALKHSLRSWQQFSESVPSVAVEIEKRRIRAELDLKHLVRKGRNIGEYNSSSLDRTIPFIRTAMLYSPELAQTPIPQGPSGRRLFEAVSDQHLFSLALRMLRETPHLTNLSRLEEADSSLVRALNRRNISQYLPFSEPGRPKVSWKGKSKDEIREAIQSYVDENHVTGVLHLRSLHSGLCKLMHDNQLSQAIVFHPKIKTGRARLTLYEDDSD